jgi:hypothetical protein
MGIHLPSALVGELVVFGIFALIVWALVREAAKIIIRVLLVVGLGIAVALMAGWLDESAAGAFLEQVGEWLLAGITGVVQFFQRAWERLQV